MKCQAHLRIVDFTQDPGMLADFIQNKPTQMWRAGQTRVGSKFAYETNGMEWTAVGEDFTETTKEVVDEVHSMWSEIKDLFEDGQVCLSLASYNENGDIPFVSIDSETVVKLGEMKCSIDYDHYDIGDECL